MYNKPELSAIESEIPPLHKPVVYDKEVFRPPGARKRGNEFMARHSFVQMSKLTAVGDRIDYISNPERQEHCYAFYATASPEFWERLSEQAQFDFWKSHQKTGRCIEARELIIALPESLQEIGSEAFTDVKALSVVIPQTVTRISGNPFAGSSVLVVFGYSGTAAETFANQYGYMFVSLNSTGVGR